jgi:hypothetical protein
MKKLLLLAFIIIALSSCEGLFGEYSMEYSVTGTASSVDITYVNEDGGTSQISDATVPWSYSFTGIEDNFVYISAQNNGKTGTVTVTIYKSGKKFKSGTSTGAYVIASASGSI